MRHIESFDRFLAEEVILNPARRRRLNRSATAVTEFLSRNLDGYRSNERQGSYAQGTIIRPVDDGEYDADILVFIAEVRGKRPRDYVVDLHACLSRNPDIADKLRQKTRCVTVKYVDEFSLDVVPCVNRNGQRSMCDSKSNQFEPTDGTGYRDWFNMKTDITNGHLKGTVCLLKYIRDHKGNFEVPSVLLTTFAGHGVHVNERGKRFRSLPDTLKTVSNRVNSFLQGTPRMPKMRNPALRSERFTRHWEEKTTATSRRNSPFTAARSTMPTTSRILRRACGSGRSCSGNGSSRSPSWDIPSVNVLRRSQIPFSISCPRKFRSLS